MNCGTRWRRQKPITRHKHRSTRRKKTSAPFPSKRLLAQRAGRNSGPFFVGVLWVNGVQKRREGNNESARVSLICLGLVVWSCTVFSPASARNIPQKCKFRLTLSRVDVLLSHSAKCRRHNDASPHLCLAGNLVLSNFLAPCELACCECADLRFSGSC